MSPAQLLKSIKPESLLPVYFLHGDESYYPNAIAKKITEIAIPDFEKGFNEIILFGKDHSAGAVVSNARRFPMMGAKQLVVVKDAEQIQDIGNKDGQSLLEAYAKNPLDSTILVLVFGKSMDERKTYLKAFNEKGIVINSKRVYDNQVPDFIQEICQSNEHKISPKAAQLLFEHTGNNLEAIVKELEKLAINLPKGSEINAEIIEKYIGISKDYNVFELQKSLIQKDVKKSFQIVQYFSANSKDHPIQPVIITLYNFFSKVLLVHSTKNDPSVNLASLLKVNPYFMKDYNMAAQKYSVGKLATIIHTLRIADKNSKGIDTGTKTDAEIYKELLLGILG